MKRITIAIDGPAGAGKSTIAKIISDRLQISYIDTGAMYRAIALKVLEHRISFEDEHSIIHLLNKTSIDFANNHIILDGEIVDDKIRSNEVSNKVSYVAKMKEVRYTLVALQRKIAENKSMVMDGRDIGTVVLPNADFKFFVTASAEERGRRRYKELLSQNENDIDLSKIIEEIKERDRIDSTRDIAPLKKSSDAIEIDTTNMTIEEAVDKIVRVINERG